MSLRNSASPPSEMASSEAPWNESHIEMVLCRPVARRASLSAMPIASAPPGANSTFSRPLSCASFLARSTAYALV